MFDEYTSFSGKRCIVTSSCCIFDFQVKLLFLTPLQIEETIENKPNSTDLSNLSTILTGGNGIFKEQMLELRHQFPGVNLTIIYGMTEISGVLTTFNPRNSKDVLLMKKKPTSCGKLVDGFVAKVIEQRTEKILGPNQVGELRIKSKFLMNGYLNNFDSDCWDEEGYFKTGDIVYFDEDYCFYHVDRIKEMIIYKSFHVVPNNVEGVISCHPAVKLCAVVGRPNSEVGDLPTAFVVLYDDANATAREILNYVNENVEREEQKIRGGLFIVNDLPKTFSGKVKRRYLRDQILMELFVKQSL